VQAEENIARSFRLGYRALRAILLFYARVHSLAHRGLRAVERAVAAGVSEALTPAELSDLSVRLYGLIAFPRQGVGQLFEWEAEWFARRLPKAPAAILVGGAGFGREAAALSRSGYQVDALEPSLRAARHCRSLTQGEVVVARYEDLSKAVLDAGVGPAGQLAGRRYAAVILGWGSLAHLFEPAEAERLLETCCRLAPGGPILASFLLGPEQDDRGQAATLGRALGRVVGASRGMSSGGSIVLAPPFCLAHTFTRERIEQLAAAVRRELVWEGVSGSYPHVTLLPR